jgi:hypothetical protein
MGKKKYFTEEERLEAKREKSRRYRRNNKEKVALKDKERYNRNREKVLGQKREYYQNNKDIKLKKNKEYRDNNKDKISDQKKEYDFTFNGRAHNLINRYKKCDRRHNRGECTLTVEWVIENILKKTCVHCGETDWHQIGCNRLDNSLPHTPDNVEPCCWKCNDRLHKESLRKTVYQYTLDGDLVKIWESTIECKRNGFNQGNVSACCRGERKRYKGYKWSYEPL